MPTLVKVMTKSRSIVPGYDVTLLPAAADEPRFGGERHGGRDRMGSDGSGDDVAVAQAAGSIVRDKIGLKTMPVETSKSLDSSEA